MLSILWSYLKNKVRQTHSRYGTLLGSWHRWFCCCIQILILLRRYSGFKHKITDLGIRPQLLSAEQTVSRSTPLLSTVINAVQHLNLLFTHNSQRTATKLSSRRCTDLEQSYAAYHICSVTSCVLLSLKDILLQTLLPIITVVVPAEWHCHLWTR